MAGACHHGDAANVVSSLELALGAHQQHPVLAVDAVAAGVAVVALDGVLQIVHGQALRGELAGIRQHLEGAHQTAQRVHVGHAIHGAQSRADRPVLDRAQLAVRVARALDAVHVDVAQGGGDRCEHHLGVFGKRLFDLVQALGHLVPRPVDVGAVNEVDDDVGQSVLGSGTQNLLARDALHFHLDRKGNTRLDLGRCEPRGLDDHLHLRRRDFGEGVDGQSTERPQAAGNHGRGGEQHHQTLNQCEANQCGDHGEASPVTMDCPAASRRLAAASAPSLSTSR
jgi:hypothetical protein